MSRARPFLEGWRLTPTPTWVGVDTGFGDVPRWGRRILVGSGYPDHRSADESREILHRGSDDWQAVTENQGPGLALHILAELG